MQLTQKETDLLKDLKGQEQLCVEKYTKHAASAMDGQLKKMFNRIAESEKEHLQIIEQMEQGKAPRMSSSDSKQQPTFTATYGVAGTPEKQADSYLCSDVLPTEKHAPALDNTCVFEFKDEQMRKTLNHIQTQEQGHGKMISDYMKANSMYM